MEVLRYEPEPEIGLTEAQVLGRMRDGLANEADDLDQADSGHRNPACDTDQPDYSFVLPIEGSMARRLFYGYGRRLFTVYCAGSGLVWPGAA